MLHFLIVYLLLVVVHHGTTPVHFTSKCVFHASNLSVFGSVGISVLTDLLGRKDPYIESYLVQSGLMLRNTRSKHVSMGREGSVFAMSVGISILIDPLVRSGPSIESHLVQAEPMLRSYHSQNVSMGREGSVYAVSVGISILIDLPTWGDPFIPLCNLNRRCEMWAHVAPCWLNRFDAAIVETLTDARCSGFSSKVGPPTFNLLYHVVSLCGSKLRTLGTLVLFTINMLVVSTARNPLGQNFWAKYVVDRCVRPAILFVLHDSDHDSLAEFFVNGTHASDRPVSVVPLVEHHVAKEVPEKAAVVRAFVGLVDDISSGEAHTISAVYVNLVEHHVRGLEVAEFLRKQEESEHLAVVFLHNVLVIQRVFVLRTVKNGAEIDVARIFFES
jgi:hypothetical protein